MDDFESILIYAFRYCLGRQTFSPLIYTEYVYKEDVFKQLSEYTKRLMIKEIDEANERNALGMDCDKEIWLNFKEKLSGNKTL